MDTIKSIANQSLMDLSIQVYGSVEGVVFMALDNDMSVTDALFPGTELKHGDASVIDPLVVRFYDDNGIKPATALPGIDYLETYAVEGYAVEDYAA